LVLLDIYLKAGETSLDLARTLHAQHIPFIYISANSSEQVLSEVTTTQPHGYVVKPFRKKDLLYTIEIAAYRYDHGLEQKLRQEQSLQTAITEAFAAAVEWEDKLLSVAQLLQPHVPFNFIIIGLEGGEDTRICSFFRVGFEEYQMIRVPDFLRMTALSADQYTTLRIEQPFAEGIHVRNGTDFSEASQHSRLLRVVAKTFRVQANVRLTFHTAQGQAFTISFYSRQAEAYTPEHVAMLDRLRQALVLTLERTLAFDEVARLSEQLGRENRFLQQEAASLASFGDIVGNSPALRAAFTQLAQVATTDATVLLLGESGTGKELFARAVHQLSARKDALLVKVNCANLPAALIESELFGHEKGAFTGATERRLGKFELAHRGTIFLDEIGELPLEMQSKLLRVLQEKEIERLGGSGPIKTDVRVVAATNRNLEQEVAEGRFRLDLYYRLSVFPLRLPALRERAEDIALLADFFARTFSQRASKPYPGLSETALAELKAYTWPGNIRELENVMEQAVILADGRQPLALGRPLLSPWVAALNAPSPPPETSLEPRTLAEVKQRQEQAERDNILAVLTRANGKIRGKGGAAELLEIKPTTLEYRMDKLGIRKLPTAPGRDDVG
jgi:transcriptional regulator with GAF, ATPase, and Fis domain